MSGPGDEPIVGSGSPWARPDAGAEAGRAPGPIGDRAAARPRYDQQPVHPRTGYRVPPGYGPPPGYGQGGPETSVWAPPGWGQAGPGWGGPYPPRPRKPFPWKVLGLVVGAVLVIALIVVGLVAFVVGPRFARTDVLDADAVAQGVTRVVTDDWHRRITDVSCPADQEVRPGVRFTCAATVDGRPVRVPVQVVGADGTYSVGQPR